MPFAIAWPTRTAKWLAGSTFLRAAQTAKACHAIAGIWICRTTSSLLVNWRVIARMLSHPRKLRALPSVPVTHSPSVKPRSLQTRSTGSRGYCRRKMSLPVPSRTKSMEILSPASGLAVLFRLLIVMKKACPPKVQPLLSHSTNWSGYLRTGLLSRFDFASRFVTPRLRIAARCLQSEQAEIARNQSRQVIDVLLRQKWPLRRGDTPTVAPPA